MNTIINNIVKSVLLVVPFTFLVSCEKVEEQKANSNKAVVEGYLVADQKIQLHVSREIVYQSNDSAEYPIEGLKISLSNGDTTEQMIDLGSGKYISNTLIARADESYSILFDYDGTTIKSSTTIPEKPVNYRASAHSITIATFTPGSGAPPSFPVPIELKWSNPDARYYLVVVENIESSPAPIYDSTRYELKMVFRNKPVQTDNTELNMRSFNYYGTHRIILFNINSEYAALYEDNGSSSLNLTAPASNIEGGLGIFTGINSDTIMVEVNK